MGSRPDGGPATLAELLESYRRMATLHGEKWAAQREAWSLGAETAYRGAADELEKVLELDEGRALLAEARFDLEALAAYVDRVAHDDTTKGPRKCIAAIDAYLGAP